MKILFAILSIFIGYFVWSALGHIYWSTDENSSQLQLSLKSHVALEPLQMEREVVRPVEYIIRESREVKSYSSFTTSQQARIIIQLKPETDIDLFKIKTNEKFRQNWNLWKQKIKYPTWVKGNKNRTSTQSFVGILPNNQSANFEKIKQHLKDVFPLSSLTKLSPIIEEKLTVRFPKKRLKPLRLNVHEIKKNLQEHLIYKNLVPSLEKFRITNSEFFNESFFYLTNGNVKIPEPDFWVHGKPAFKIELETKKTIQQLLKSNLNRILKLNGGIVLYPLNFVEQSIPKKIRWGFIIFLMAPIIALLIIGFNFYILIVFLEFSLVSWLLYFNQPITLTTTGILLIFIYSPIVLRIAGTTIQFTWGYTFLLGYLMLYNHVVSPSYDLRFFSVVCINGILIIYLFDLFSKEEHKRPIYNLKFHLKKYLSSLAILCVIGGVMWFKNKNYFQYKNESHNPLPNDNELRLEVSLTDGIKKNDFIEKLLLILNFLKKTEEVTTTIVDSRPINGVNVLIKINVHSHQLISSRIRNTLEKFMLNQPNQTFVIHGLGKELAHTNEVIFRGVYLKLKGFYYPDLLKNAHAIQTSLEKNKRVSQPYIGPIAGPAILSSKKTLVVKTSESNKQLLVSMINDYETDKTNLLLSDTLINLEAVPSNNFHWTALLNQPVLHKKKLMANPLQENEIQPFTNQKEIYKHNGLYELVIGFNFLGSKRQTQHFLSQKQNEIDQSIPFGIALKENTTNDLNKWNNLMIYGCFLAIFFTILNYNNLAMGMAMFFINVLIYFIGQWLIVAIFQPNSILKFMPLLSYGVFLINHIHGAFLFKSE